MFDEMKEGIREVLTNRTPENDLRARLHADHVEIARLIDELLATEEYEISMREDLRDRIVMDLTVHARAEEEVVYDFLAQHPATQAGTQQAFHEHDEMDRLLALLDRMDGSDVNLELIVDQLKEAVQRHVHEEETELLPTGEQEIGQERLAQLIPLFNARKASVGAEMASRAQARETVGYRRTTLAYEETDSRY
jgi:hemerythrin superfamily protein